MCVTLIILTWTPKSCDFLDLFVEKRRLTVLPIQAELFSQWSVRMSDLESANIWYSIFWIIMNSSLTVKIGLVRRSDRAANFICCFSYCLNKFRKDIATYLLSYFFFFFCAGEDRFNFLYFSCDISLIDEMVENQWTVTQFPAIRMSLSLLCLLEWDVNCCALRSLPLSPWAPNCLWLLTSLSVLVYSTGNKI